MKKEDQKRSFLERLAVSESVATQEDAAQEVAESHDDNPGGSGGGSSMVDEFRDMEKAIKSASSEEEMLNPLESDTPAQEGQLTLDVYQTDDSIVIKSTIAGVNAKDIDVSITKDVVTIRGVRNNTDNVPEEQYFYQECYWGPFSRSIILPVEVKAEESVASIKDGVLSIALPKVDIDVATKIQVMEE